MATYNYVDEDGNLLFQVVRKRPKKFLQRQPCPNGGNCGAKDERGKVICKKDPDGSWWHWNLDGVTPVLYKLPELRQAVQRGETVFIPEGEKDVDNLTQLGLAATTSPMGAGKWRDYYSDWLKGANVVILPDNDEPGRRHAQQAAQSLYDKAASVKILELPDLPANGDVSDWLAAGGTKEELLRLAEGVPEWEPGPITQKQQTQDDDEKKITQAQLLVSLAADAELFHTPKSDCYATIPVGSHKENWPLKSMHFRRWLQRRFYEVQEKPAGAQALYDALGVLEAKALFDGPELPLFTRIAESGGKIYIDLCNDAWEVVEISPDGWQVVTDCPVKFGRAKGMLPLPKPEAGGNINDLRRYVNVGNDADWRLLVAWLIAAMRPQGPYPVLVLQGEQGSAKSTTARVLRSLVDPSSVPLRTTPREERDLAITAGNSWMLVYDNLSGITTWLSDAFCRVSTGGGFTTRTLYTDNEETLFDYMRPIIINGIDEIVTRHDLLDRSLIITLPVIPDDRRQDEDTFWAAFNSVRPRIFGALLDAVAAGLRNIDSVRLHKLPRMADFAKWVTAAEEALPWPKG